MLPARSAQLAGTARGTGYALLRVARLVVVFLGLLKFPACDDFRFPRDPDGTLERVLASGRMSVVAVDHVPWVVVERDGSPVGSEVEVVEAFARSVGATIEWRRAAAFKALRLDLPRRGRDPGG
jgi:hypothetical protein